MGAAAGRSGHRLAGGAPVGCRDGAGVGGRGRGRDRGHREGTRVGDTGVGDRG